jgi:SAM-dependent methyltransferase
MQRPTEAQSQPPRPAPPAASTALDAWLAGPLGQRLLEAEAREVGTALEDVFGNQFLQVGHWGHEATFLPLARTPRRALVAEPGARGDCVSHAASLAVLTQSVDAVLLPHTLEFEPEPHAVLREVDRVLVGDGHLLVLGFEPTGSWALRHRLARDGFPPGLMGMLSRRRLRDWLTLLGFEVIATRRFVHVLPVTALEAGTVSRALERLGDRLGGQLGNAYLLKARKRVYTLTPIRPRRRRQPKVAGAAVEST